MLLPYRAKNPPERPPYITLGLIAVNVLVFALTSEDLLVARRDAVASYAVTYNNLASLHLLTSLFMHGSLLHLAGNMLFFWIFGPSLEGRLGMVKYTILYLMSGISGTLLHAFVLGSANPDLPSLGASGAIMGLCGAYLYVFPYSRIRTLWFLGCFPIGRYGIRDMQARWIVVYFLFWNFIDGYFSSGSDGVAHFAHLGGAGAGLLLAFLFSPERDNENYSTAQAVRAEVRDYTLLNLAELEQLIQHPTPDVDLILTYCDKALTSGHGDGEARCVAAILRFHRLLDEQADPTRLANLLLRLDAESVRYLSLVFYLRVGSRLERAGAPDFAARMYRRIYDVASRAGETEVALFRLARLYDQVYRKPNDARSCYLEMVRLFPNGVMGQEARRTMPHLTAPTPQPFDTGPNDDRRLSP